MSEDAKEEGEEAETMIDNLLKNISCQPSVLLTNRLAFLQRKLLKYINQARL